MNEPKDRRLIGLAVFALIAIGVVAGVLIGQNAGDDGSSSSSAQAGVVDCKKVAAPKPKTVQYTAPPQTVTAGEKLTATMETSCGTFKFALDPKTSPKTVNSFVFLAGKGFYDGLDFHQIIPSVVIQGGDPAGNGSGGPGYTVVDKPPADLKYKIGDVAMAKTSTEPDGTSGSQFYVITGPQGAALPPQYALLGHVTEGMNVVDAIGKLGSPAGTPKQTVLIDKVTVEGG
jgi:peptidyl-prolyl cis-trans isomerase B (cyclophilin B)